MPSEVIVALISACIPTATTAITAVAQARASNRHAARQSILQMILEDQFGWFSSKKLPINYQNIMEEYDSYHKNGGNGVITEKVEDYKRWFIAVEKEKRDENNN